MMNNLVYIPKSRKLRNRNSNNDFMNWSQWIDGIFNTELPDVLNSNFNDGISKPKVNIQEKENAFNITMAVPGFDKSDFQIDLADDVLSISVEKKEEKEEKDTDFTVKEFGYSTFKRSFTLPESVDENKIHASYKSGILNITLPKKEAAKPKPAKKIEISGIVDK